MGGQARSPGNAVKVSSASSPAVCIDSVEKCRAVILSLTGACKTAGTSGQPCIFPFIYAGQTFHSCTAQDSDTGQPWCATSLDREGWVVDHAWGDCGQGCPGTRRDRPAGPYNNNEFQNLNVTRNISHWRRESVLTSQFPGLFPTGGELQ